MLLVGLSGGIASGKSTVSRILLDCGCPIIDADQIARQIVQPGLPSWHAIVRKFGREILNEDETINREKLGKIVFDDPAKRRVLNGCTHPAILRRMLWQILTNFIRGEKVVILDSPLLFESGTFVRYVHRTIVVWCCEERQIERLYLRNGFDRDSALKRIRAQMPLDEKRRRATYVIDNDDQLENTRQQTQQIYEELIKSKWCLMGRIFRLSCSFLIGLFVALWFLS